MGMKRSLAGSLALALLLLGHATAAGKASDRDEWNMDEEDEEFWKDSPPSPSTKVDEDGKTLQAMTFKFLSVRLKPDKRRTLADANRIADAVREKLVDESLAGKVNVQGKDMLALSSQEEVEDLTKAIFELEEVYDVQSSRLGDIAKPGLKLSYAEAWVKEYGAGVPVPGQPSGQPTKAAPAAPKAEKKTKKKKKKGGKKSKTKKAQKQGVNVAEAGGEEIEWVDFETVRASAAAGKGAKKVEL